MRINEKQLFPEDSQGQILFQTGGTTRLTIDGTGVTTLGASVLSGAVSGLTATSASFSGTISIGSTTADAVGFYGVTPVGIQSTSATTGTFAAAAGTAALSGSTWVGNSGTRAYTVSDVISALKQYKLLLP